MQFRIFSIRDSIFICKCFNIIFNIDFKGADFVVLGLFFVLGLQFYRLEFLVTIIYKVTRNVLTMERNKLLICPRCYFFKIFFFKIIVSHIKICFFLILSFVHFIPKIVADIHMAILVATIYNYIF